MKKKFVRNKYNTRIPCICQVRTADIYLFDNFIGTISEEANDAGETDWVIKIDWESWEKAGCPSFPGIDLDLRLDEYVRTMLPSFVSKRTVPDNRVNLYEELEAVGLTWNDRFEFMVRHGGICGNDRYTVRRHGE